MNSLDNPAKYPYGRLAPIPSTRPQPSIIIRQNSESQFLGGSGNIPFVVKLIGQFLLIMTLFLCILGPNGSHAAMDKTGLSHSRFDIMEKDSDSRFKGLHEKFPDEKKEKPSGDKCTITVSPTAVVIDPSGGESGVEVTVTGECRWTAVSNDPNWLAITNGAAGTESDTVKFRVLPNNQVNDRTGTINIAGKTVSVSQAGGCKADLSRPDQMFGPDNGQGEFMVNAPDGCSWNAVAQNDWISITSGITGSGKQAVIFSVAANPGVNPRTGRITAAGQTFTVMQQPICLYDLLTLPRDFTAEGGRGSFQIRTGDHCPWTVSNNSRWMLEVLSEISGIGNGTVDYKVWASNYHVSRTGTIQVETSSYLVRQSAVCDYGFSPDHISCSPGGCEPSISVSVDNPSHHFIPYECAWTATSNDPSWITINYADPGDGNGTLNLSVAANSSSSSRNGSITVGGTRVPVTQGHCELDVSVPYQSNSYDVMGGQGSFSITANYNYCPWHVETDADWITFITPAEGTGNATLSYSVGLNYPGGSRAATIRVDGTWRTVQISQAACQYELPYRGITFQPQGGVGSVEVDTQDVCPWTTTSDSTWITLDANVSGTGTGRSGYSVAPNNTGAERTGHILMAGQNFTVTQRTPSTECRYSLSAVDIPIPNQGGTSQFTITTGPECPWATSLDYYNQSWISFDGESSGYGNGTVAVTVAPNTHPDEYQPHRTRTGNIRIVGTSVRIIQDKKPCAYSLNPSARSFNPPGGSGEIRLFLDTSIHNQYCSYYCSQQGQAESNDSWISILSNQPPRPYTVQAHTGPWPRTGAITIAGQTHAVTQYGVCPLTLAPAAGFLPVEGGAGYFDVINTSNCEWHVLTDANWLQITSDNSGSGNGRVEYSAWQNISHIPRTVNISVSDKFFPVTQPGVPCPLTFSPTNHSFGHDGGTGQVNLAQLSASNTTDLDFCSSWVAESNVGWITITGEEYRSIEFSVTPNRSRTTRIGTITIRTPGTNPDVTIIVTQQAKPCEYNLSPQQQEFPRSGGSGTFGIEIVDDGIDTESCRNFSARSREDWITITESLPGNSTERILVNFDVAPLTQGSERTGRIFAAGKVFTVVQKDVACLYTLTPERAVVSHIGATGSIKVATQELCGWEASSAFPWIHITSFDCAQLHLPSSESLTSNAIDLFKKKENIPQKPTLRKPVDKPLIARIDRDYGNMHPVRRCFGSGELQYSVDAAINRTREGEITIAGKSFPILQTFRRFGGKDLCNTPVLSPESASFDHNAGVAEIEIAIESGCAWQASSDSSWIIIYPASEDASIRYQVTQNIETRPRAGAITINDTVFPISQEAAPCTVSLSPESKSFGSSGGTDTIAVTAPEGCEWKAINNQAWIGILSGSPGSGNGTVSYRVNPNPGQSGREGTITFGGRDFRVVQTAQ
ncbi:MAG: hypothetical protein KKE17_00800 [Proteobacteria bacterium]|nr:hypothetical protein [Pseudomonadota bacterium]